MKNLLSIISFLSVVSFTHAETTEDYASLQFGQEDCNFNYFPGAIGITAEITLPEGFEIPAGLTPHPGVLIRFNDPNLPEPNISGSGGIINYDSQTKTFTFVIDINGWQYVQEQPEIMYFGGKVDFVDLNGVIPPVRIETHPDSLIPITLPWTVTGLDEESGDSKLFVYPNPTAGDITITGLRDVDEQIFVYDMTGKRVKSVPVSGHDTQRLDLFGLPKGLYVLEVIDKKRQVRHLKISKI